MTILVESIQTPAISEDTILIQRAKDGNADAFGELYNHYAEAVFRFIYSQTHNRLDAEDITGEVFLRAWRSLPRYQDRGYLFTTYLFRIARNVVIDQRRKQRPVQAVSDDEIMDVPDAMNSEPSVVVSKKIRHSELVKALDQLKEEHRTVLVLRFLNELSHTEVSEIMGRSVGAIRILQYRALSALRKLMPAYGLEL